MQLREALPSRLMRKMCLSCGYHGRALQGDRGHSVYQCPACGEDLYARPSRSYAEMEGFVDHALDDRSATHRMVIDVASPARQGGTLGLSRRIGRLCRKVVRSLI